MKKLLCLILSLLFCVNFWGCQEEKPKLEQPVRFYYLTSTPENGIQDKVIDAVSVEGAGKLEDIHSLLNEYLRGTSEPGFETTFPASTKILKLTVSDSIAAVEMNSAIARLSGIDLTIACACITMTVMELTGASQVRISASNSTLDGAETVVMDINSLTMLDIYTPEPT